MTAQIVAILYDSWDHLDYVLAGLTDEQAADKGDGSAIAWSAAHLANNVDSLINVRLAGLPPHPVVSQDRFRFGGDGEAADWPVIQRATQQVRDTARRFLDGLSSEELETRVPYEGSMVHVRETGLSPAYSSARVAAHHFIHIGEIEAIRRRLGHEVGDYPAMMRWSLGV